MSRSNGSRARYRSTTVSLDIFVDDLSTAGGQYARVASACPSAMLYHSESYGRFLKAVLPDARCQYLVATMDGQPVAALPTFSLENEKHGTVVNSLPFYGSHGGILLVRDCPEGVAEFLMRAFHDRNRAGGVVAATVVSNLADESPLYWQPDPMLTDRRIGQRTPLPESGTEEEVSERLLASFHAKTRNHVRKGLKSGYTFREDGSATMFETLEKLHREGMAAIGGRAKKPLFFSAIPDTFEYGREFRLFVADSADGTIGAILLVLYHGDYAEYFCPVSDSAQRSSQPLSALIHHAMIQSVLQNGSTCWNWGGTWLSQDGVYDFKSRWGTHDQDYDYKIWLYPENGDVTRLTREELAEAYPDFFVVPYSALADEHTGAVDA